MSNPVSKHMGFSGLSNIINNGGAGVTYTTGGAGGGGGVYGPPGTGGVNINYKLTAERLEEWQWFTNFMDQNPDVKERFAVHKTYEILKDDNQK